MEIKPGYKTSEAQIMAAVTAIFTFLVAQGYLTEGEVNEYMLLITALLPVAYTAFRTMLKIAHSRPQQETPTPYTLAEWLKGLGGYAEDESE